MSKPQEFKPTPAMRLYAYQKSKLPDNTSQAEICRQVGIGAERATRWKETQGYEEWLEERVAHFRIPILKTLERIAMEQLDDHKFWDSMSQKYGFTRTEDEKGGKTITVKYKLEKE